MKIMFAGQILPPENCQHEGQRVYKKIYYYPTDTRHRANSDPMLAIIYDAGPTPNPYLSNKQ